jgi:hypothetical protein
MKHYVVLLYWVSKEGGDVDIIGVTHSIDEAKEIFNKNVEFERKYVEDHLYDIYKDIDVMFSAGNEDSYIKLYIQGVM